MRQSSAFTSARMTRSADRGAGSRTPRRVDSASVNRSSTTSRSENAAPLAPADPPPRIQGERIDGIRIHAEPEKQLVVAPHSIVGPDRFLRTGEPVIDR